MGWLHTKADPKKNLSEPLLEITFSSKDLEISFSYWFDKFFIPYGGQIIFLSRAWKSLKCLNLSV